MRKCGGMGENRRNFSGWFGRVLRIRLLKFIKNYIDISVVGITVSAVFLTFQTEMIIEIHLLLGLIIYALCAIISNDNVMKETFNDYSRKTVSSRYEIY